MPKRRTLREAYLIHSDVEEHRLDLGPAEPLLEWGPETIQGIVAHDAETLVPVVSQRERVGQRHAERSDSIGQRHPPDDRRGDTRGQGNNARQRSLDSAPNLPPDA